MSKVPSHLGGTDDDARLGAPIMGMRFVAGPQFVAGGRTLAGRPSRGVSGFALLDVLASLFVLAIIVVPLFTLLLSLRSQAGAEFERLDLRADSWHLGAFGSAATWDWGGRPTDARWEVGPQLAVCLSPVGPDRVVVGTWANGWFVGEDSCDRGQSIQVESASFWSCHAGEEVIMRVRAEGEGWGPPFRTMVPSGTNAETGTAPAANGEQAGRNAVYFSGVVHLRQAGTAVLQWGATRAGVLPGAATPGSTPLAGIAALDYTGAAFILPVGGTVHLEMGGSTQLVLVDGGRDLDVYW